MPRQSRSSTRSRSSSVPAKRAPSTTNNSSKSNVPATQQQSSGGGIFSNIASMAVASTIGHTLGNAVSGAFGGSGVTEENDAPLSNTYSNDTVSANSCEDVKTKFELSIA